MHINNQLFIQNIAKTAFALTKPVIVLKKHNDNLFSNYLFIH